MNAAAVHKEIIKALQTQAGTANAGQSSDSYTGSSHTFYAVPVPVRRQIVKEVVRAHKAATPDKWLVLVDALIGGKSHEEKTMGAYVLGYVGEARQAAGLARLDTWLEALVGWAEIDSFCWNLFPAEEMLCNWPAWQKFLVQLSKDANINKRRASLVFLTGVTQRSADARLHTLAYKNIEQLKCEKDILITKAISWLLRSQADTCPQEVATYLEQNLDILPKIAIRETKHKLTTGKKNK